MGEIEVFNVGSLVAIASGLQARIVQICIRNGNVQYQVSWYDSRTRKCEWIEEFEVIERLTEKDQQKLKIGFK